MVEQDIKEPEEPGLERAAYLDERKLLVDAEREAARSFDKSMITLCGAALGLSITFVQYIAPIPQATTLLWLAWLCFSLALIVTLASFLTAQSALRKQRDMLDQEYKRATEHARPNAFATWTNRLNISSIVLFISGVALLACFSMKNLPKGEEMMNKQPSEKPLQEGFVPPKPPAKPQPQTPQPKPSRPSGPAKE